MAFFLNIGAEVRAATLVLCAGMAILAHLVVFIDRDEQPVNLPEAAAHILASLTLLICLLVATIHWYLAVRGLTFTGWFDYRIGLIFLMWVMGIMEARRTWRQIH